MAQEHEIRTVTTLRKKREEILTTIKGYERRLHQARADLAHVTATIAIFESKGETASLLPYDGIKRLFRYGEALALCLAALQDGPLNTRQLALKVMEAKGFETGDKVMAKVIAQRLVNTL